ncbi:MAG: DUF4405 domain-containing protein [Phycisphaerae bacterium]|nr:DUF4405 domain-containing protein [Phycisphaerae bacterium]
MANNKTSVRPFVSSMTALTFLAMAFTGCILYVTPPGRVAHWTNWKMLGLMKEQWGALHICFSLFFVIFSIIHLILNWKAMLSYLKNRMTRKFALRPCWVSSLVICIFISVGTLNNWPPFAQVMAINDKVKNSWEQADQVAPVPHAELLTLKDLAQKAGIELEPMIANLKAAGIEVASPDVIFGDLAKENGMAADKLYIIAVGELKSDKPAASAPMGMGRMTLKQLCEKQGIELDKAIENLKKENIEATGDMRVKAIATAGDLKPVDIMGIIAK